MRDIVKDNEGLKKRRIVMNYRYYILKGKMWVETNYETYSNWENKKYRSLSNVLDDLNNGKIKVGKKWYQVGTTVELDVEATSLEEAKEVLYDKLKSLGLDVGDLNGFEVPEDDSED